MDASYTTTSSVGSVSMSSDVSLQSRQRSSGIRKQGQQPTTESSFVFDAAESQAATSVFASGLNEQARMDPAIATGLSIANNFAGPTSVSMGATMQESFIQASISIDQFDLLSTRLHGLCRPPTNFIEHEEALSVLISNTPSTNPIASASGTLPSLVVRVRRSLLPKSGHTNEFPSLRYLGAVESGNNVFRRSCLEVPVSGPIVPFLASLGFKKKFDFVAKGQLFIRGRAKVTVFSINEITKWCIPQESGEKYPLKYENAYPKSLMVEISAVGSPADDSLQKEVSDLMELLWPLVIPGSVDHALFMGL